MVFGFDSCIGQPLMVLYNMPRFITGQITFNGLVEIWNNHYGKEMHYSAFLIYGLMYWALSRHFEKNLNITKSRNVAYAASLTLFSIAVFEFYWILSYAHFQSQPWVAKLQWPQLRIILQNIAFFFVGVLAILYIWADSYVLRGKEVVGRKHHYNLNLHATLLVSLSIASALLWWNYPFQVDTCQVRLENGDLWTNSRQFPQTLYTIDMNPDDSLNAGEWFFVEDNTVHAVNTLVKVVWTFTMFYIFMLKPVKEKTDGKV